MTDLDYLTVREFAELFRVSTQLVRNEIRTESIKAIRVGKAFRIPRSEVERLALGNNGDSAA